MNSRRMLNVFNIRLGDWVWAHGLHFKFPGLGSRAEGLLLYDDLSKA